MAEAPSATAADQPSVGASRAACRPNAAARKELKVKLFGEERSFGELPTKSHTDIRHAIEMFRRGKQPRLAEERLVALQEALAEPGSKFSTLAELRSQIEVWRAEGRRKFNADTYYDEERAIAYTEHNRGSQEGLTRRALELASFSASPTAGDKGSSNDRSALVPGCMLALDLGCGSGLSTRVMTSLPGTTPTLVLAMDMSRDMLQCSSWGEEEALMRRALRVQCDLSQPLPLRAGLFDVAFSVAAVHYLAEDAVSRCAHDRLVTFFKSLRSKLHEKARPTVLQIFVIKEAPTIARTKEAAIASGWALCQLVCDATHSGNAGERDYLYLLRDPPLGCRELSAPPSCRLYRSRGHHAACALGLDEWARANGLPGAQLEDSHRGWLEREHWRYAKRLVRLHSRGKSAQPLEHAGAEELQEAGQVAESLSKLLQGDAEKEEDTDGQRWKALMKLLHTDL